MVVRIAVDGHSLNLGLQKVAQTLNTERKERFRIDHERLAEFLAYPHQLEDVQLRFYTDDEKPGPEISKPLGKIVKYIDNKGYGFIAGTDGEKHFFHHNAIINKKALAESSGGRYPHPMTKDFRDRLSGKVVSFDAVVGEDGRSKAEEVRVELGNHALDKFYQLRREPFLQMLEETGYHIIRCRAARHTGKSKSIDCKIILDSLLDLKENDTLVLLSDDPVMTELVAALAKRGVKVELATFKVSRSDEIRVATEKAGGKITLLDEHLDDLKLEYLTDEEFDGEDDEVQLGDKAESLASG